MSNAPITITRADNKVGDKVRVEYPQLTSGSVESFPFSRIAAREFFANEDEDPFCRQSQETLTLLERPVPPVVIPTEPGIYLDRQGDAWKLPEYEGATLICLGAATNYQAKDYAPFVRLVPEPTAKKDPLNVVALRQILADISGSGECTTTNVFRARSNVQALIAAEQAK